jgi:hypothetical protein
MELLEGALPVAATAPVRTRAATLVTLDATMGMPGTPQSGTGQAALLTGTNAAAEFGRHFGPWVPAMLRPNVRDRNLLTQAARAGRSVAFANAYPEEVKHAARTLGAPADEDLDGVEPEASGVMQALPSDGGNGRARRAARYLSAGPPLAALGAGVLVRHTPELERGDAIASEITNAGWRERLGRRAVPVITPYQAGRNLARIAANHDLTLFAHYSTDYAGHQKTMDAAVSALRVIDEFIAGILAHRPDDVLMIVASDHGNLEDITTDHTMNPVLGLAVGEGHAEITRAWKSILDVAPSILRTIQVKSAA